jgi:hypothetical protein
MQGNVLLRHLTKVKDHPGCQNAVYHALRSGIASVSWAHPTASRRTLKEGIGIVAAASINDASLIVKKEANTGAARAIKAFAIEIARVCEGPASEERQETHWQCKQSRSLHRDGKS